MQAWQPAACSSRTASSASPSSDTNLSIAPLPRLAMPTPPAESVFLRLERNNSSPDDHRQQHNLELQLLPSSNTYLSRNSYENQATHLKLSIGSCSGASDLNEPNCPKVGATESILTASRLKEGANEQLKLALSEKALAEEARQQAKKQIELAEMEFANAKRIRQQAQTELEKAQILKEQATKKISSSLLHITCHACKQQFQATTATATIRADETSLAKSYMSSAITEGEEEES